MTSRCLAYSRLGSVGSVIVVSSQGRNASWISAAVLTKSRTRTSSCALSGWIRFSSESVRTAARPVSGLSTYIPHSSGSSNPVWYLSTTTKIRYSLCPRAAAAGSSAFTYPNRSGNCDSGNPLSCESVNDSLLRSSVKDPENATRVPQSVNPRSAT